MSEMQPDNNNTPVDSSLPVNNNNNNDSKTSAENVVNLNSDSLTASVSSTENASSSGAKIATAPKPTGIKPPSRIGRPCGNQHKPALPTTPTKSNSSDDSIRRVTDDFGRHRLTDVLEEENEEEGFGRTSNHKNRNRYSSIGSTASSVDALWDIHPRRLSEAGLSRHSDSSAVLTEDTDSFIIGQRVWVSGTKPGHIAFIGETQFAPGEWAGIALDEPIGKNDGSVGGIHYFQCEPKKGVFSRLTRLTRFPLAQEGMGSGDTYISSPPANNGVRRSPISPTGSTKSLLKSPVSISGSNTSLASSATHVIDYRVGDRVIIKSSQGSKVGTVKYIGTTDFANGEWVGVELDDPRGKNDGSVNGRRYFDCRPNFGLFAPVSKVSKSPSKFKPGACQIHSGSGLPPSGMKRTNSKESMLSNLSMTSATSGIRRTAPTKTTTTPIPTRTALQDVLKEKQQHIEQLLKERDLERAEITRAASQADEAEQKLTTLRQEYEKYRSECEIKLQEHMNLLNKLKEDRNELVSQLDDEKRKNEDLLFRLEEASITKDDIEKKVLAQSVTNEGNIVKIKELEEQLKRERDKVDSLEADANKLFEAEENLIKAKEEIESVRNQLQESRNKEISLEGDHASTAILISSLQKEGDQYKKDLEEKNEMINVLKQEISKLSSEMTEQLEASENKRSEIESSCTKKDSEISNLKAELEQVSKLAQDKIEALEKITTEKLNSETSLEKQIEKLKMELSVKILDVETISEILKEKENGIVKLKTELEATKNDLDTRNKELEQYQNNLSTVESNLRTELEALREQLKQKTTENEDIKADLSNQILERDRKIEENNNTMLTNFEEIKRLTNDLENLRKTFDNSTIELEQKFKKEMEEKENLLKERAIEIQHMGEEISRIVDISSKTKSEYELKCAEFDKLKKEFESAKKELEDNLNTKSVDLQKVNEALKHKEDELQALQTELQTTKVDLESVSNNLIQYQSNLSDVEANLKKERDEIKESLKTKIVELEDAKKEFSEKYSQKDKQVEELTLALSKKSEEVENLIKDIASLKEIQVKLNADIVEKHTKEIADMNEKLSSLSEDIQKKNEEISFVSTKANQLEETIKGKELEIENFNKELAAKGKQQETESKLITELSEKLELLTKVNEDLTLKNSELEKLRVSLENSNTLHENEITVLNNELHSKTEHIKQKEEIIKNLEAEVKSTKNNLEKASNDLIQYQSNLSDVEANLKKERDEIRTSLEVKTNEFENVKKELLERVSQNEVKLEEEAKTILKKNEELNKLNTEVSTLKSNNEKNMQEINEKHKQALEDMEIKVSDLLTEIENKTSEITKLSETVVKYEDSVNEKTNELRKLHEALELVKKQNQSGDETVLKLSQRVKELETSNEEFNKQLLESTKKLAEILPQKAKLEEEVKLLSSSAGDVSTKLDILNKQLLEKDNILETTKCELQKELETFKNTVQTLQGNNKQLEVKMEEQRTQYEEQLKLALESEETLKDIIAASSNDSEKIKDLQKNLANANSTLAEKEKQLNIQNTEILKLKEELIKVNSQQKNVNGTLDNSDPNSAEINSKTDYKQLLEEKIFAENQVAFLNSIIVDMQKKNEEQKARIEILEMGYNSSAADELAALGFKTDFKQPTPRMYCDICEEFDLHETEDCPTQGDEEPMPVNLHLGKESKGKPPPRDYCEACGVFGHATEDCTEDQEF